MNVLLIFFGFLLLVVGGEFIVRSSAQQAQEKVISANARLIT